MSGLDVFSRLEIILTKGKSSVCLVAFGPTTVRAIELGSIYERGIEAIPQEAAKRRAKSTQTVAPNHSSGTSRDPDDVFLRDVTFLAKTGESSFFAERIGNGIVIHSLCAIGDAVEAIQLQL